MDAPTAAQPNRIHETIFGSSIARAALFLAVLFGARVGRADFNYTLQPNGSVAQRFNTSATTETEDGFVANSYTVMPGGTRLESVTFPRTPLPAGEKAQVAIYTGSSLIDPHAGAGLVRVAQGSATLDQSSSGPYSVALDQPVDLPDRQVFYVGLLLPGIPGTTMPFLVDPFSGKLNRSFFDVGPTRGAPYNLDDTANLTVLGGVHPVVGNATPAGNLLLNVIAVPEPSAIAFAAIAGFGFLRRVRERSTRAPHELLKREASIVPEPLESRILMSGTWNTVDTIASQLGPSVSAMAADKAGNVYAVGWELFGTTSYLREKPAGSAAWTTVATMNGGQYGEFNGVAVDAAGDVFVTGRNSSAYFATWEVAKGTTTLQQIDVDSVAGGVGAKVSTDQSGNVYVVGTDHTKYKGGTTDKSTVRKGTFSGGKWTFSTVDQPLQSQGNAYGVTVAPSGIYVVGKYNGNWTIRKSATGATGT